MRRILSLLGLAFTVALTAGEDAPPPAFEIPKLAEIKLDGDPADWAGKGYAVKGLKPVDGAARSAPNFDATFRIAWDDRGLLLLVQVSDDIASEPALKIEEIWKGDSIEAFVAAEAGKTMAYQVVLAPGRGGEKKELRYNLSDYRKDFRDKLTLEAARAVSDSGYTVEILFPWKNLKLEPKAGATVALQLFANDVDEGESRYQSLWYPKPDAHLDSANMHTLKLVEGAISTDPPKAP